MHRVVPSAETTRGRRDGRQGVGAAHSSREGGEPFRGTRWSQGAARSRSVEGKDHGGLAFHHSLNETTTDSRIVQADAGSSDAYPGPPHGHRLAQGSPPAHPKGWSRRGGRANSPGLRGESGGQPPVPAGTSQSRRPIQGSPGAKGLHPQSGWKPAAPGHPHLRGQGPSEGGGHAHGTDL